jgi:RimJ/RimL family protein N-acetyltransferase
MCDFAVGASGSTTWERMCLGVPSILISIAENQNSNLEYLARAGYIISAGYVKRNISQNIKNGLDTILFGDTLLEMKQKCLMLVDGNGAKRVAEIITPNAWKNYHLRKAEIQDIYDCFKWANDPLVRANSIKKNEFSWERHKKWFLEKLVSNNSKIFILEVNFLPVGFIRFDRFEKCSDALISLTIDPLFHGRGYGKKILSLGLKKVNYSKFIAFVKDTNKVSMNLFGLAGFVRIESDIKTQFYRYELTNFN